MNAPSPERAILLKHVAAIESRYPLKIVGTLPRGWAAHIDDPDAIDFLADKGEGLSYLGISGAEVDLGDLLGRTVGIVMRSELDVREGEEAPKLVAPL